MLGEGLLLKILCGFATSRGLRQSRFRITFSLRKANRANGAIAETHLYRTTCDMKKIVAVTLGMDVKNGDLYTIVTMSSFNSITFFLL